MNSKRLLAVASFIEKEDVVVDIGCDHAYLDIYLIKNKLCKKTIASDIATGALKQAKINIEKYGLAKQIKTVISDGLNNIFDKDINTIVISGMGTNNILNILNDSKIKNIKKIIIQSNNNLEMLRKEMNKRKFKIENEIVVFENNKYYPIIKYVPGNQKLKSREYLVGIYNSKNLNYYIHLYNKNLEILAKLPKYKFNKILKLKYFNMILKKYLKNS